MQKKVSLFLFLLIITNDVVFGKHKNKTKSVQPASKTSSDLKNKQLDRIKRSLNDDSDKLFSTNINDDSSKINLDKRKFYNDPKLDEPFWANRGRRESSETFGKFQLPGNIKYIGNIRGLRPTHDTLQGKLEENSPFWGNRGRRDSFEIVESHPYPDEKLIKYRARKQEDEPFWGTRGRREEESILGNKGQSEFLLRPDEDDPFWGNRGRRQETEPFWGNRGRRDSLDPFWSSLGKKDESTRYSINEETEPFWGNRGRRKFGLKESIIEAINDVKENIDDLAKGQSAISLPFWSNRARDSKIKHLFHGATRNRMQQDLSTFTRNDNRDLIKPLHPNTVTNSEIFAEEPHFILVERSSRSSGEIDPFYISRGKKYSELDETAARDRRGALEEIVKNVRNDPYYIARGKKSMKYVRIGNISVMKDDVIKVKELICAIVDMLSSRQDNKVKREIVDVNERDRRTILKKLALQLQNDPYYVSRGKKNVKERTDTNVETLKTFVNHVTAMCI